MGYYQIMPNQIDEWGQLVLQALESLAEQGRLGKSWGVPLLDIVEEAGTLRGIDWTSSPDFDIKVEEGMQHLIDLEIAEGPQPIPDKWRQPTNWWADTTVFTLKEGYEAIIAALPALSDKAQNQDIIGERSRLSLLSQPQPPDTPSLGM